MTALVDEQGRLRPPVQATPGRGDDPTSVRAGATGGGRHGSPPVAVLAAG